MDKNKNNLTTREGMIDAVDEKIEKNNQLIIIEEIVESEKQEEPEINIFKAFEKNEDGDAELFIHFNKGKFCFDHALNRWFKWNGHYWIEDKIEEVYSGFDPVIAAYEMELETEKISAEMNKELNDIEELKVNENKIKNLMSRIGTLHSARRKKSVLSLTIKGKDSLGISGEEWDQNPFLLGCENGVIDLTCGIFRDGKYDDSIKTIAPTKWEGLNATAPTWEKFLFEIFDGDKDLIDYVQRLFGYALIGKTTEHIFPILWGKGRNGKSTLIEVLKYVLGDLSSPINAEMLLKQSNSRSSSSPTPDILDLRGKRLVWASETDEGRQINVGKAKWLVGGDTLVGRAVYGKNIINFEPTHTLIILTNHKPHIPANEYALWERVHLLPFNLSFVDSPCKENERKRDPDLKDKLIDESSGILTWLVAGCIKYQEFGLNPPETVLRATENYQKEEDLISTFVDECCVEGENCSAKAGELYTAYKEWCDICGYEPDSNKTFGTKMTDLYEKKKKKTGMMYFGIGLLDKKVQQYHD